LWTPTCAARRCTNCSRSANNLGLTNYLLKQNTIAEVVQTTQVPNLDFMASGKLPNSSMGILGSAQMKEMIAELKQRYDFIFFDSPPILGVSDASILASEVDLVMQVIQYRRYPQPMTIRAKQMIEKVGGNFVGIVLNNINMSQDEATITTAATTTITIEVPEMPGAGEGHRHAARVGRRDDLRVLHRTAGLDRRRRAPASAAAMSPSGNGKNASLQTTLPCKSEFRLARLPHRDAAGIHAAHLARARAERAAFADVKDRV
jgi:hypothetical protein